ncbi:MAG: metalloregulator ArsR/SmtB family transcription factor [Pseudomonadota bacterium]
MPSRVEVANKLSVIFKLIAHPDRIRIIEELYSGERDVGTLASRLELKNPRVSQHLHEMKLHGIVSERREGRYHHYSLVTPSLATWIVDATQFVESSSLTLEPAQIDAARKLWMSSDTNQDEQPA